MNEITFQCSICYNDMDNKSEIYRITSCHCQFCQQCVHQYVISQVNIGSIPIQCPTNGCNYSLSTNEIRSFLTNAQFNLYNKLLLDYEVTNDPRRFFCPHVDCGHILAVPDARKQRPITCTRCHNPICSKCRREWHSTEDCTRLVISYANPIHSDIKHCPRCSVLLERVNGCAQITCVNCKHIFCWYCLRSLEKDFFLLHYERGSCRNRLGHSRLSLFLHRLLTIGLFLLLIFLLIVTSPLLIIILPYLFCCGQKQLRNYFDRSSTPYQSVIDTV
ncbi:unnamed protein product [Adineta ricciae]|uniref:RBR-type E3 ubiquitin transferase n=1 Tax=Adineta ricciae TaxID=249248 RepID=A0A813T3L0_ADIRI|nr:unnamed protein product [Adineta ricciae]CAF0872206.1 unnamed protein product [Adineta ricciae]